jgi:hypothetical protein
VVSDILNTSINQKFAKPGHFATPLLAVAAVVRGSLSHQHDAGSVTLFGLWKVYGDSLKEFLLRLRGQP